MVLKSVILVIAIGGVWPQAAEALSCYSCSGDACVNGVDLVTCNGVQDSCYTKFDGYVPIQRGCVSDLTGAECSGSACVSCNSDFCNIYGAANHKCVTCSSTLDDKCISDPGSLTPVQCGAPSINVADAQCYSRVIGFVTERGCIQSQTDLDICDGTQCATCTGEGCNNGEFPAHRQKCVICSSQPTCNTYATTSYCNLPDDSCVTAQMNDGTYLKTCEQSMSDSDRQFCQTNPSLCRFCTQYECNKNEINLQDPGRQCYTCQGSECLRSSLEIETCHNTDDNCFTIFDGYNPVQRGCRSTLTAQDKAICDDPNDVDCALCAENLCNLQGRKDHVCAYCSSVVDGNCVVPTDQLRSVQCPAPTTEVTADAQCYTRVIGTVTERGCLGSATDAEQCDPTKNCATCAIEGGKACNTAVFPADRRKCVVGTLADQYCPNPWDNCVQIADSSSSAGSNVKKCQSSMTAEEVSFCQANSNKCDFCADDNCNEAEVTFDYLECLSCNSQDDPACTTNPSLLTSIESCSTCVTLLTNTSQGQQILQRGCLADLSPEDADQCVNHNNPNSNVMCATCSTNKCNVDIYPSNRLECYQCLQPPCISHDTITPEYCQIYSTTDRCIMLTDTRGLPIRLGCNSSLSSAEQNSCKTNPQHCFYGSKSKSNDPNVLLNSNKCVQCSSAYEPDCMGNANIFDALPCNDPLNTQCYSRFLNGRTTERGCLNDLDTSSRNQCLLGPNCAVCSSRIEKCNSKEYPMGQIKCYQCDSKTNAACKNAQSGSATFCPSYNSENKCYILVQKNGDTVRKCSTQPRNTECAGAEQCEVCRFSQCNGRVSTAVMPAIIAGSRYTTTATTAKPARDAANLN